MRVRKARKVKRRPENCGIQRFLLFGFQLLAVFSLCGCAVWRWEFVGEEMPPYNEQIAWNYHRIELKMSNAANVLAIAYLPEYELLTKSKSVVAFSGEKRKGYKSWLNMVAFDQNKLTAKRKYLVITDERPQLLCLEPKQNLSFDCEVVLEQEILDEPYANENARRIAMLRQLLENFRKDIDELGQDNKTIATTGMLVNQALETVLVKLDSSPALAVKIGDDKGFEFNHSSFNKGKIQMVVAYDIVTVKMRLGSLARKFAPLDFGYFPYFTGE